MTKAELIVRLGIAHVRLGIAHAEIARLGAELERRKIKPTRVAWINGRRPIKCTRPDGSVYFE